MNDQDHSNSFKLFVFFKQLFFFISLNNPSRSSIGRFFSQEYPRWRKMSFVRKNVRSLTKTMPSLPVCRLCPRCGFLQIWSHPCIDIFIKFFALFINVCIHLSNLLFIIKCIYYWLLLFIYLFYKDNDEGWRKHLETVKITYWCVGVRQNGNFELYSVPDFTLRLFLHTNSAIEWTQIFMFKMT